MTNPIKFFYHRVFQSFWFIPAVLSLLAIFGSSFLNLLDQWIGFEPPESWSWFFSKSPEGARAVLSTIAGSTVTVLGVILSSMIVVLTLASQQFGPRLVRNFISDRASQVVVGCFAGCFIYSIITLKSINNSGQEMQPHFSIFVAVMLAVGCIGLLIFFVHHVSSEIQVQSIMRRVYTDLNQSIEDLFPESLGKDVPTSDGPSVEDFESKRPDTSLQAPRSGYVQSIDDEKLMGVCQKHDLTIHLTIRPGIFAHNEMDIADIFHAGALNGEVLDELKSCFLLGTFPTSEQDALYPIALLEEIAIRALSPGINDPHTALECIDYLASSLIVLAQREWPSPLRCDATGRLRVRAMPSPFEDYVRRAYQQIHHYGCRDVAIVEKLFMALDKIYLAAEKYMERREILLTFAREILDKSEGLMEASSDKAKIRSAFEATQLNQE